MLRGSPFCKASWLAPAWRRSARASSRPPEARLQGEVEQLLIETRDEKLPGITWAGKIAFDAALAEIHDHARRFFKIIASRTALPARLQVLLGAHGMSHRNFAAEQRAQCFVRQMRAEPRKDMIE